MKQPTPRRESRQLFLEHKARHEFNLRRNRRNARRYIRAMSACGIGLEAEGSRLRVFGGRLPSRSRRHLARLWPHILAELEHLAQPAVEHPATEMVQ